MSKKNKIRLIFLIVIILVICAYFSLNGWFIAYTNDAYVRANVSVVAPRVNGYVSKIFVDSNEYVTKGTLLMKLYDKPYQLELNVQESALKQAKAELDTLNIKYATDKEELKEVKNQYSLALINYNRNKELVKSQAVSKVMFENVENTLDQAANSLSSTLAETQYDEVGIDAKKIEINALEAKVELAKYYLEQTNVYASGDGYVTHFNVRPGDYLTAGQELFSIVENNHWWIIADYKSSVIRHIKPGQTVYIHTDMYPLRLFKGKVSFIGRGTSRNPTPPMVLPYIEPTTDWIILERRFEITIDFTDLPKDVTLAEGDNATTFIIL